MDKEELLLDLSYKIVHAISDNKDSQSQEEKESVINILNSMNFFVKNGNFDRAISEGENLLILWNNLLSIVEILSSVS